MICSLLASCKELGLNPREYLTDILSRLPYYTRPGSAEDIGELLPDRWQTAFAVCDDATGAGVDKSQ